MSNDATNILNSVYTINELIGRERLLKEINIIWKINRQSRELGHSIL